MRVSLPFLGQPERYLEVPQKFEYNPIAHPIYLGFGPFSWPPSYFNCGKAT